MAFYSGIKCDGCGVTFEYPNDVHSWLRLNSIAGSGGWRRYDDKLLCDKCVARDKEHKQTASEIINQFPESLVIKDGRDTTTYYSFKTVSKIVTSILEQKKRLPPLND